MERHRITHQGIEINATSQGDGPPLVFANSLGSTLAIWDGVIDALPPGLRIIRYDLRGHGATSVPRGPYSMGQLVSDAEAVCDTLGVKNAVFVGLSVGGMIGQGLAIKRLDLVRGLVLSNTAAKIGSPAMWDDRIAGVREHGMSKMAETIIPRWFGKDFLDTGQVAPWQAMLTGIDPEGYAGVCTAIKGTDFYTPTSGLRLPTLAIAGSEDKSTPPDLVRETAGLIPGSDFQLMRRLGHLPCIEDPAGYAEILTQYLRRIGHID